MADARASADILVALGGNTPSEVGDPAQTLRAALEALADLGAPAGAISAFYATPCFPVGAGPDYVNAAARLDCDLAPSDILTILHRVEAQFGRTRTRRWGRRTLDLDLIAHGDRVLPDRATYEAWRAMPLDDQMGRAPGEMILPHPRLHERAFVLVPLNDIAPDWRHPVLGRSVAEMLADLPQNRRDEVTALR